jgi:membrane protein DedA with SNARE-associated domain
MFEHILNLLEGIVGSAIQSGGYFAIVAMMAIESACIPLPSEIIMPLGGIAASKGELNFHLVAIAGALGNALGSALAYWVGRTGGRPFIEKYGKYVLIKKKEIEHADAWFARFGQLAVFLARLLPIIRTFISLPAGIYRMKFWPFLVLSFIGSIPWCYGLAVIGYQFQEHRPKIKEYFHLFDYAIAAALVILVVYWVVKKRSSSEPNNDSSPPPT